MSFTNPPAAPPAAVPIPSRLTDSQTAFDAKTDTYLNWQATFRDWLSGLVTWCSTFIAEITATQVAIDSAATAAIGAADAALAASNFKGLWVDLAGPLNKPACVKHGGRFWLLLGDLANVAASEPGVSADWTPTDVGIAPTSTITVSAVAIPGVCYVLAASDITLTLPAAYGKGIYQGVRLVDGVTGCAVDFGVHKYQGRDVGLLLLDVPLARLDLNYEDINVGMR